ncbi:protein of unknown function [Duganella sp. CF402]|uniref:DUF4034 domain-containing protein n=1 Tax=unclassified Duganella TaxID=2636909 RepID=UPI0008ACA5DB|nr:MULTISPECIES: DUF4034 domain-containing protein [unclassified Duganella]RZT08342.1 uncharacterized protein DUF4034 [Duganella sp. BK701]SEL97360.1 protein of unknown function [Duganella sp. CF402]
MKLHHILPALLLCAAVPASAAYDSPLREQAIQAFWWGDFAALEQQNAVLRQPGHISSDGTQEIEWFRIGVDKVIHQEAKDQEAYLQELEKLTLQWTKEHPQSALAHVLYAKVLVAHAWAYRGGGFVKDVPPAAWKDFETYLQRATQYLLDHGEVALSDSYGHDALLTIAKATSWDDKQLWDIINDGLKRNPEDASLYFTALTAVLPKWGGDVRRLDKFIRKAAEQTKAQFGTGMYSRLYSLAAEQEFGHALFQTSHVDWPTMKQSYEDMLARYPSDGRRNRYAYMACLAKDKPTLLTQLDLLGDKVAPDSWGANPQRSLEGCQRWAREG